MNLHRPFEGAAAFGLLLCSLLMAGCAAAEPTLTGTPTPGPVATPTPTPFTLRVTASPEETDMMGRPVESEDHYFESYLSFGELRVYIHNEGTFMDGICVNTYPKALKGSLRMVWRDENGTILGEGTIHTADGGPLQTGTNRIFSEINTDIDLQMKDFTLEVTEPFLPAEEE